MSARQNIHKLGIVALVSAVLIASGAVSPAIASPDEDAGPTGVSVQPASGRVVADPTGQALTPPSESAPADIALRFVRENRRTSGSRQMRQRSCMCRRSSRSRPAQPRCISASGLTGSGCAMR